MTHGSTLLQFCRAPKKPFPDSLISTHPSLLCVDDFVDSNTAGTVGQVHIAAVQEGLLGSLLLQT